MLLFLQIIYYMISSIWPVFFIVLMYLIWKDVNHIAAKIAPEYYYEEDYEDDEDEEDEKSYIEEQKQTSKISKNKRKKLEKNGPNELEIEDLD